MSKTTTTVRIERDGRMLRKTETGWEEVLREPLSPPDPNFVPAYDSENPPLTDEIAARRKKVPRARTLRRQMSLTQEEFAARYQIPIGTLRDWEQHRSEPDAPAKAYLKVIAADPEGVAAVLARTSKFAAE
jgi:putative transcriptional regulator